jgi:hypothetical protein
MPVLCVSLVTWSCSIGDVSYDSSVCDMEGNDFLWSSWCKFGYILGCFCSFVRACVLLVMSHPHCSVKYRASGPHFVKDRICTSLVDLSTVSFISRECSVGASVTFDLRAVDYIGGLLFPPCI